MDNRHRNRILILIFIGVFMGSLDIGIVGPALPAIQGQFGVNERLVSWIFAIYILFFMIGTPLMAKLSDIYGRRSIYVLDIFIFALGSAITVTSVSFEQLLIGRAIQGFGAGGIFPVASAFIGDTFPPEKRGGALGIIGSVWGLSGILGPILGALLLNYGWQWLFIINIPIAAVIIALSFYILPVTKRQENVRFDWQGTVVFALMVGALAVGVNQIDTANFTSSLLSLYVWPFLALSVVLLPLLLKVERYALDPVIQIDLYKSFEVKIATSIAIGTGLCQTAIVFMPALAVVALSLTTSHASLMVIPLVLALGVSAPVIGRLLDKFGTKMVMFVGTLILAVGLFMLSFFASSFYLFILSGVVIGLGLATVLGSPLRYIMLTESPADKRAAGQALINFNASAGQLVGGAMIGAVIGSQADKLTGYQSAYILIAFLAVGMMLLTLGLKNRAKQLETMKLNQEH
ncbi:MFS transporter [uncultured Methanobacterium sp.]|uniref:MFS transporter n=1 Tax=uncultured Methanobacterium sp. TaxID=176306 RepID=UPI002AA6D245|nr:MFS transporter [uncultured Methanobacterium sp.]